MTLIVGLRCSDGVVLGADSAATFGNQVSTTIRQETNKLFILPDDRAVVGVSGSSGIAQTIVGELGRFCAGEIGDDAQEVAAELAVRMSEAISPLIRAAGTTKEIYGDKAYNDVVSESLTVMPVGQELALIHLNQTFSPSVATRSLPFVAIGSGEANADPFLAFLKEIYFPDGDIGVINGEFIVFWALHHACTTHHGGVSEPLQIMTLSYDARLVIREHSKNDLKEHGDMVRAVCEAMKDFRNSFVSRTRESMDAKAGIPGASAMPIPPTDIN